MIPAGQFQTFYQAELRPHLEELEVRRKQVAGRVMTTGAVIGVPTVILGLYMIQRSGKWAAGLIPAIFAGLLFFWLYGRFTAGWVAEFKDRIIGRIVQYVDPGLTYRRQGMITEAEYQSSLIFLRSADRYRGEDLVWGKVGVTAIKFSEVHSEYRTESTDSKGRRQTKWHTIFRGVFFIADFNKHFAGQTVVLPDMAQNLFGQIGQLFQSWNLTRPGQLVRLEDVAFEEAFVVYSTDQIEARYLLSPALMARILDFRTRTNRAIYLSFVASNLHVAIANARDLFEPKLFRSVVDVALAQQYLDDLMLVVGIVAELNLNTRIWTKA